MFYTDRMSEHQVMPEAWEVNVLAAYGLRAIPADTICETQALTVEQVSGVLSRFCGHTEYPEWAEFAAAYLAHTRLIHAPDGWDREVAAEAARTARGGGLVEVLWEPLPTRQPIEAVEPVADEVDTETVETVLGGLREWAIPPAVDDPDGRLDELGSPVTVTPEKLVEEFVDVADDVSADRIAAAVDVLATAEDHDDPSVRAMAEDLRERLALLEQAIVEAADRKTALADLAAYRVVVEARIVVVEAQIDALRVELGRLMLAGTEPGVRQWADDREMWPHETQPLPAAVVFAYLKDINGD